MFPERKIYFSKMFPERKIYFGKMFHERKIEGCCFEKIEDESEYRHPMAGFGYYQTMKRNRAERKRLHEEQRAVIQ